MHAEGNPSVCFYLKEIRMLFQEQIDPNKQYEVECWFDGATWPNPGGPSCLWSGNQTQRCDDRGTVGVFRRRPHVKQSGRVRRALPGSPIPDRAWHYRGESLW